MTKTARVRARPVLFPPAAAHSSVCVCVCISVCVRPCFAARARPTSRSYRGAPTSTNLQSTERSGRRREGRQAEGSRPAARRHAALPRHRDAPAQLMGPAAAPPAGRAPAAAAAALPHVPGAVAAQGHPRRDPRGHQVGWDVEGGAGNCDPPEGGRQGAEPQEPHPQLLRQQLPRPRE